uniref:ADAM metallopeptidase with thrombospondin type 1 motif, 12 n=1 Tax=Hucho hucho TaxID=62062 RepID=A0A4W5KAS0_9TELE
MLSSGRFLQSQSDLSMVHPVKIDRDGQFLSHSLAHRFERVRLKRDLGPLEGRVYYKVNYKGRNLVFNLTVNNYLVSNKYVLEWRNGSLNRTEHRTKGENACHLIGTVTDPTNARGTAAISTCEGLKGLFTLPEGPHFIQPVQGSTDGAVEKEGPEPHVVYPSVTTAPHRYRRSSEARDTHSPCGVRGEWVETLVVADTKLIDYHGSDNVESYIFTIMNMVITASCHDSSNVCQILWCSVNGSCRSKLDSPIDGTSCGPKKWCISGECVIVGKLPETVNGNWGQWSSWSHCSRTCGAGVQSAHRECNHPKPEFGGKYCTGERRRYHICNTKPCQKAKPTFREMLCSEFDTVPYQNELYEWVPVASLSSPCELHCRPVDEHFSEKMLDAVTDGTPCFMNNNSRSICVNGVCKEVGCDYGIDSNAVEDRCGVCLGDGSSCETVQMTFDGGDGFGYVDVGVIPEGARDIVVQEMEEAGNFLALRGQGSEEYFLNGEYIIQWNGEYKAGGTTFYYERSGNLENLTAPGPTKQPVMIQLLYQEKNPGIKYEYTIKRNRQTGNEVIKSEYKWRHGAWTDCSTTCGLGEQQQPVRCFELEVGVVDEALCDPESRPEDRHHKCKNMDCPARWWVGGWQLCSATCGSGGVRKRTVLCVRTVAGEERVLHPGDCKQLLKPKPVVPCNRDLLCGPDWAAGNWSMCPVTCGGSVRTRMVTCLTAPPKKCDIKTMPRSKSLCALQSCPSAGLRRRPGPPPKYRRVYLPKRQPTRQPVKHFYTVLHTFRLPLSLLTCCLGQCSTSCGLGAVWRPVLCSSQQESDCANLKRPEPARTCHLRPCATWLSGIWSKCPKGCEVVGWKQREVQCVDEQKGRPLRPFHCQVLSSRPPSTLSCRPQPCQPWRTSPWGQCSRSCGGGLRERLVYCPEPQRCSATQRPNDTETCNLQPCSYWDPQDWEECSVSCGEGLQHRVVRCVVEDSDSYIAVELSQCSVLCCDCVGPLCRKNSMSSRFCDKLKLLGRCSLRSIQKQCCITCRGYVNFSPMSHLLSNTVECQSECQAV